MTQISLAEALKDMPQLLARARAGEEIVVVDGDRPMVRILPADSIPDDTAKTSGSRTPGALKGRLVVPARLLEPMSEAELAEWEGGGT